MNRAVRKMMNRRCALKATNANMYGGGLAVNSLAPYTSANGAPIESRIYTDECYDVLRPGEIRAEANPSLAQAAMAGGSSKRSAYAGGAVANPISMTRRRKTQRRKTQRKGRKQMGGTCPCEFKRQQGGSKGGFGVDPSFNVGGDGPIAAPANVAVPCDTRAGIMSSATQMNPDPRAYNMGYSATANQTAPIGQAGGAYVDTRIPNFAYSATQAGGSRHSSYKGGAYTGHSNMKGGAYTGHSNMKGGAYGSGFEGPDCYKAPGSEMPVYPAQSVGFNFSPSTGAGAAYSDGVTPFNEVNQVVARTGGGKRPARKSRKGCRKASHKANRKAHRKSRRNGRK